MEQSLEEMCDQDIEESLPLRELVRTSAFWKEQFVSGTGIFTVSHPVQALYETTLGNLSHASSMISRLEATALLWGGLGFAMDRSREWSREKLGISDDTNEYIQMAYDSLFVGLASFLVAIPMYSLSTFAAGDPVTWEGVRSTSWKAALLGFAMGPAAGISLDLFLDAAGIKTSERVKNVGETARRKAESIRAKYGDTRRSRMYDRIDKLAQAYHNSSNRFKQKVCAGALAATLALTAGIYAYLPDKKAELNAVDVAPVVEVYE